MRHAFLKTAAIVTAKELKDFFRDPRSIVLSLVLPLVLFPLMFWVVKGQGKPAETKGEIFTIAVEAGFDAGVYSFESDRTELVPVDSSYPFEWRRDFDAVLVENPTDGFPAIVYDNTNQTSIAAYLFLMQLNASLPAAVGKTESTGSARNDLGMALYSEEDAAGRVFLGLILPFIFFIFAITCPLPVSADLSAGEKERGSLDPLLSTAASRGAILSGKLAAAFAAGLCSVCAYLLGIMLSCIITPEIMGEQQMVFNMTGTQVLMLVLLLIAMTALFALIEVCAGFIARSVREAQLLSMPLLVIGVSAVYVAQAQNPAHLSAAYAHIPLVNLALAIRNTALGQVDMFVVPVAFLWALVYFAVISFLALKMLKKETVYGWGQKRKSLLAR